ncbi:MAG: flavodoxin family protein [Candidatus Micrarchaeia archaeon]
MPQIEKNPAKFVFAVNGSPRGRMGNTERVLQPFLEGARDAGARTEVAYLKDKNIGYCNGCMACWRSPIQECALKDDMPGLLKKITEADIIVYATPLYSFSMTGLMKNFMDRMLPLLLPTIKKLDGKYTHPHSYDKYLDQKVILLSTCGFPGGREANYGPLVSTFKAYFGRVYSTEILVPQGHVLKHSEKYTQVAPFIEAVRQAGAEFVRDGAISEKVREVLGKDIADPFALMASINKYWKGGGNCNG